jgi:hypothetical protein
MVRLAILGAWLAAACDSGGRQIADAFDGHVGIELDASTIDAWLPPPPSHDAGQPAATSCGGDASTTCALPPSTCLDENYLLYYTDPVCDGGTCRYTTNLMYCVCVNDGCDGGFT